MLAQLEQGPGPARRRGGERRSCRVVQSSVESVRPLVDGRSRLDGELVFTQALGWQPSAFALLCSRSATAHQ